MRFIEVGDYLTKLVERWELDCLIKLFEKRAHYSFTCIFACGLFAGFMPMPFQMVLAAALAIIFRANLAISIGLVWFSNPLTMPPIFYFAYKVGMWILNTPPQPITFTFSWTWFHTQFLHIWKPLLMGSLSCGIVSAIIGYWIVRISYGLYSLKK